MTLMCRGAVHPHPSTPILDRRRAEQAGGETRVTSDTRHGAAHALTCDRGLYLSLHTCCRGRCLRCGWRERKVSGDVSFLCSRRREPRAPES